MKKEEAGSLVHTGGTRGNGYKLKHMKFHLNTGKHFLTAQVVKYLNRLPREVVESPPVGIFKPRLDTVLDNLLCDPASAGGLV